MTATTPPRAPLVAILRGLPDVGLDVLTHASRVAAGAVRTTTTVAVTTLDLASRPAPVQATLHVVADRVAPAQARGAQTRRAEVSRLGAFGRTAGDALIAVGMRVVERLPIDQMLGSINLNALLANVDLNALLANVDLNALLASVDLGPVINDALKELDFGAVIRESTSGVTTEMRDVGRAGAMHGDLIVARVFDKVLRRRQREVEVGFAT
jgi:hypothetical protein